MRVCARVLVAALMVGAIAAALAFPGRYGQDRGQLGALNAAPSSHQRTVRLPGLPSRNVPTSDRLSQSGPRASEPAVARPPLSTATPYPALSNGRAAKHLKAPPAPRPVRAPPTPTRELASESQAPPLTSPVKADEIRSKHGHGHGKEARGKAKGTGKPGGPAASPPAPQS